jgi:hypothetical protein
VLNGDGVDEQALYRDAQPFLPRELIGIYAIIKVVREVTREPA